MSKIKDPMAEILKEYANHISYHVDEAKKNLPDYVDPSEIDLLGIHTLYEALHTHDPSLSSLKTNYSRKFKDNVKALKRDHPEAIDRLMITRQKREAKENPVTPNNAPVSTTIIPKTPKEE